MWLLNVSGDFYALKPLLNCVNNILKMSGTYTRSVNMFCCLFHANSKIFSGKIVFIFSNVILSIIKHKPQCVIFSANV